MTQLKHIAPQDVAAGLAKGRVTLIDIREKDEYARAHIKDALHIPLSVLEKTDMDIEAGRQVVFHCRSGNRTDVHCDRLDAHIGGDALFMQGGLNAWKTAGLPIVEDKSMPLEINRQVQITAGLLTLVGVVLGFTVHPGFFGLSAFIGAGLTFSGLSGTCAMANGLMLMPWNRSARG